LTFKVRTLPKINIPLFSIYRYPQKSEIYITNEKWYESHQFFDRRICTFSTLEAERSSLNWQQKLRQGLDRSWMSVFGLPSISSTFYMRVFPTKVLLYFHQSQNVTRKSCTKHFCTQKLLIKRWWNWHLVWNRLDFDALENGQSCW